MRFLKTKILKAQETHVKKATWKQETQAVNDVVAKQPVISVPSVINSTPAAQIASEISQSRHKQTFGQVRKTQKRTQEGSTRATKNIVINFGKAIASFAVSPLATPYLTSILEKENITSKEFSAFVTEAKGGIGGIDSFRLLLLISENDNLKLAGCKKAFAEIGTVFIKYFSVNWITHGRVAHKMTYLKYRNKVLRRIQNPKLFTYISEEKRRKSV